MYTLFFSSRDKARTFKQAYKGSFKAQIKDNGKEAATGKRFVVQLRK